MKDDIIKMILYIQQQKIKRKIAPNYALRLELIRLLTKRLDIYLEELEKDGKIKSGQTMNDKYYEMQNREESI